MRELSECRPPATFAVFFGHELRRYRTMAGLTLDQLGATVNYTGAFVGLVEQAKRSCPRDLAERADTELQARGALASLWAVMHEEAHPALLQSYVRAEEEAVRINAFQPTLITGLLQTEEYATEVIRAERPEASRQEIRQAVAARMRRGAILKREAPPRFWLIQGEAALRQVIGGSKIMFDQLTALLEAAEWPRVTVQVLPFSAGAHPALNGSLVLLEGRHWSAYCEGYAARRLITDPEEVAECAHAFNLLQSAALNVRDSLDAIRDVVQEFSP